MTFLVLKHEIHHEFSLSGLAAHGNKQQVPFFCDFEWSYDFRRLFHSFSKLLCDGLTLINVTYFFLNQCDSIRDP